MAQASQLASGSVYQSTSICAKECARVPSRTEDTGLHSTPRCGPAPLPAAASWLEDPFPVDYQRKLLGSDTGSSVTLSSPHPMGQCHGDKGLWSFPPRSAWPAAAFLPIVTHRLFRTSLAGTAIGQVGRASCPQQGHTVPARSGGPATGN